MENREFLRRPLLTVEKGPVDLRVMSYNCLAQAMIRRDRYPTNGSILKLAVRKKVLKSEVSSYRPDVLAIQEMDADLMKFWRELLHNIDMDFVFHANPNKRHGLCIAWRKDLYTLVRRKAFDYDSVDHGVPRQTETGNIGLIVELARCRSPLASVLPDLVIGNTHLYWHPGASYERSRQLHAFISEALAFTKKARTDPATLLLGDFNTEPFDPAYLLATGKTLDDRALQILDQSVSTKDFDQKKPLPDTTAADETRQELRGAEGSEPPSLPPDRATMLQDTEMALAKLHEAYAGLSAVGISTYSRYGDVHPENSEHFGEPGYTNWTDDFEGTLDYIFLLSPKNRDTTGGSSPVVVRQLLRIPDKAELGPQPNSLPRSGINPSDHFSIMAGISWR